MIDMTALLDQLDDLASQRPVAAKLVMMTDDDEVGAKELAAVLQLDPGITARVMRLANSAYYGLGGRVSNALRAVTVVGFSTVRSMAAVSAAGLDNPDDAPEGFWESSKTTAVAASELATTFGLPSPDMFCVGLLSGFGQAILHRHDPERYALLTKSVAGKSRRHLIDAEIAEYGISHSQVSAAALTEWSFPKNMTEAVRMLDPLMSATTPPRAVCLRGAVEISSRILDPRRDRTDVAMLTEGQVSEDLLGSIFPIIKKAAAETQW